ncbi:MAG: hypothetical protein GYB58_05645 [Gammaproteobacteria bacterium]|nr:hypothetical protein [Gammaproteobacteria bacterium]
MSELQMLLKEYPIQALRNCFHFKDGSTDTKRAASFFKVSQRTVQHWINTGQLPPWAETLLSIHYRGYLPDTPDWKDFYIQGNQLCFNGYYGPRSLTPGQLRTLDLAFASVDRDSVFWDNYQIARQRDDNRQTAREHQHQLHTQKRHLEALLPKQDNPYQAKAIKRRIKALDAKLSEFRPVD